MNEPKNSASRIAIRRGHVPLSVRCTNARTAKNSPTTATGFQISSDSHGAIPSADSPPEMTTAGWK